MKLYMKQKVFSMTARFTIRDECENDVYSVEGEFFSLGRRLHIFDTQDNEVAYVEQKVFSLLPRFFVYVGGRSVAEIVKRFTLFKPVYELEGTNWQLEGDYWAHDYKLTEGQNTIMHLYKEWLTWGDSYVLNIANPSDAVMCLAIALAVDCVIDASRSS